MVQGLGAERDSTVEGPLNAPTGWTSYTYPLGFDITADGAHMVYGYSNTTGFSPIIFGRGFYVRPVTSSSLEPIAVPGCCIRRSSARA